MILAAGGAEFAASRFVDRSFVQERLAERFGDDQVRVHLGDVSFSLFRRRIEATDVVVSKPGVATVSAARIVASGLPWPGGGEVPKIGSVDLERPLVFLHPEPDSTADEGDETRERFGRRGPGDPILRVGRLRVSGGTIVVWRPSPPDGPRSVVIRQLGVEGREVEWDGGGQLTGSPDALAWQCGPFSRTAADGLTHVSFDSLRASGADSTFQISGLRFAPVSTDSAFFRRLDRRRDRLRASLPLVRGRGFDLDAWIRRDLVVRAVEFDSVDIDVLSNRRLPTGPGGGRAPLPPNIVRSFGGEVAIDTIRVAGRIVYRELPERPVRRAAEMDFEQFDSRITGVSSAPDAPPMVVATTMQLFDAPAEIRIEIPYDTATYRMKMTGRVGPTDLTRLNVLTVPLQGIEVQDGRLVAMRFDVDVAGRTAGGTVWAAYRDLDVQMVDRRTGEGGLFDDIKSFVANTFVLKGKNMPGKDDAEGTRPGTVEYYVAPGDTFFTRVWAPIRSGLMAVAKG